MDLWIETDALEAVRKVYDEYLTEQYKNNPSERLHRLLGFGNGAPNPDDAKALKLAGEAYVNGIKAGGTDLEASAAAGDALYCEFARERFIRLEADPHLYRTNAQYHQNLNEKAALAVKEELNERSQQGRQLATAAVPGPKSSLGLESNQKQSQQRPQIAAERAAELHDGEQSAQIVKCPQVNDSKDNFQGARLSDSQQQIQKTLSPVQSSGMSEAAKEILARPAESLRKEGPRRREASIEQGTTKAVEDHTPSAQEREEKIGREAPRPADHNPALVPRSPDQNERIDLKRYAQDPDYRREVKEQVTKRQGQDRQNQLEMTVQMSRAR